MQYPGVPAVVPPNIKELNRELGNTMMTMCLR